MSDAPQGPGWWLASDGRFYPPPSPPPQSPPGGWPAQERPEDGRGPKRVYAILGTAALLGILLLVILVATDHSSSKTPSDSNSRQRSISQVSFFFRPVYCQIPAYAPPTSSTTTSIPTVSQTDCRDPNAASIPSTPPIEDNGAEPVILPADSKAFSGGSNFRYVLGPADLTASVISRVSAQVSTATGQYSIALTLTPQGAAQFDTIAAARYACYQQAPSNPPYCSLEAFELNGLVESAPTFQAASFNGNVQVTGSFTRSQASALANELKLAATSGS